MVQSAFAIQLNPPVFPVRFWANIGQQLSHIVSITTADNSMVPMSTISVPWDEDIVIVDPTNRKTKGKCSLAEAHIPREGRAVPSNK